jgi:hypothetical protein
MQHILAKRNQARLAPNKGLLGHGTVWILSIVKLYVLLTPSMYVLTSNKDTTLKIIFGVHLLTQLRQFL